METFQSAEQCIDRGVAYRRRAGIRREARKSHIAYGCQLRVKPQGKKVALRKRASTTVLGHLIHRHFPLRNVLLPRLTRSCSSDCADLSRLESTSTCLAPQSACSGTQMELGAVSSCEACSCACCCAGTSQATTPTLG